MKVYVAMIAGRHTDPDPVVFSTAEAASGYARSWARAHAIRPEDFEEPDVPDGRLYYASYSVEGDDVWVIEREVDQFGTGDQQ